jgi:hypothetical protein
MSLLNTYKVEVKGFLRVEASSSQDALQAAEDKLQRIDREVTLATGDVFQVTEYR